MSQGRHRRASRRWRRALRAVEQRHVPDRRIAPAPAHWRCGRTSTLRQRSRPTRPVPAVSGLESGEPIRDLEDAIDLHERSEAHRLVPGLRRLEGNDDGPRSGETTNESCTPPWRGSASARPTTENEPPTRVRFQDGWTLSRARVGREPEPTKTARSAAFPMNGVRSARPAPRRPDRRPRPSCGHWSP